MVDKEYCMSSYLALRTIADHKKSFSADITPVFYDDRFTREPVHSSEELEEKLRIIMHEATKDGKAALALSGGIDSAILAKFMPHGSVAYTFRCVVPGVKTIDESEAAAEYAKECGLEHRVIDIYWEDFEKYTPKLMKRKGAPLHSIEIQIHKAALQAKQDGFETFIFGESADANYGGLSNILSRDWTVGEFVDRYSYIRPYYVLREPVDIITPFLDFEAEGMIDVHSFFQKAFFLESMGSYTNACDLAEIGFEAPYGRTFMAEPLDLNRVRHGENKYWIRSIFDHLYPGYEIPVKTPMPRATNEWLKNWRGPTRSEFWPNCVKNMSGDQRWLVYCLEWFLNLLDEGYFANEKV